MSSPARKYIPKAHRKAARTFMYRKLYAIWNQLRPDLRKSSDEYKDQLYAFAESTLKLPPIGSLTELSDAQLSRVIEALEREQRQPRLQHAEAVIHEQGNVVHCDFGARSTSDRQPATSDQTVEHLASEQQAWTINRLFGWLGWSLEGRKDFLKKNFRRESAAMLTKKQAHSAISILFNCAGSKYWKRQGKEKVSKPMIQAAIPKIKAELGIN